MCAVQAVILFLIETHEDAEKRLERGTAVL